PPVPRSTRWLAPLCLVSHLWAFSFGVNAPLASLWMQRAGCGDSLIGLNTGTYYLGIALAAGALPWLLSRFGPTPLLAGMLGSAVTAAAFPSGGGPAGWFGLRLANGVAAALSLIPLETYVNRHSAPGRRAWNFGLYAVCIASGVALGNLVALQMAASRPRLAFLAAGAAAPGAPAGVCWVRAGGPGGRRGGPGGAAPRRQLPGFRERVESGLPGGLHGRAAADLPALGGPARRRGELADGRAGPGRHPGPGPGRLAGRPAGA